MICEEGKAGNLSLKRLNQIFVISIRSVQHYFTTLFPWKYDGATKRLTSLCIDSLSVTCIFSLAFLTFKFKANKEKKCVIGKKNWSKMISCYHIECPILNKMQCFWQINCFSSLILKTSHSRLFKLY